MLIEENFIVVFVMIGFSVFSVVSGIVVVL